MIGGSWLLECAKAAGLLSVMGRDRFILKFADSVGKLQVMLAKTLNSFLVFFDERSEAFVLLRVHL